MAISLPDGAPAETPVANPWTVFITLLIGCFITIEAAAFQAPAMPSIARHFGVNEDVTALIILLYYLGLVVFSPVFGRIADRFGRKRVIRSEEHTSELQSRENLVC